MAGVIPPSALAIASALLYPKIVLARPFDWPADFVFGPVASIVSALMAWYLGQRLLAFLLVRKSTAYCPQCFDPHIHRARPKDFELSVPFLPSYNCRKCGIHFFRGRKPPFARCPRCRTGKVRAIVGNYSHAGLLNSMRGLLGGHRYSCAVCEFQFVDFRPLRVSAPVPLETFRSDVPVPSETPTGTDIARLDSKSGLKEMIPV